MEEIVEFVFEAKKSSEKMNMLIENYLPFIRQCVSHSKLNIQPQEDALTIAMLTFADCVMAYETDRGSFLAFVKISIRNRLIDDFRVENKHHTVPLLEENQESWDTRLSIAEHHRSLEQAALRLEIDEITFILHSWNTSFGELVKICPKQKRTRAQCQYIAVLLLKNTVWKKQLFEKQRLPNKELCEIYGVSIKTLEKYRKYIATLCIIQSGDFPMLKAFLPINLYGGEKDE